MTGIDWHNYVQKLTQPIESAESLPYEAYTDPQVLISETKNVFHKDWVFVCSTSQLPKPGHYFALDLAGEPVVIIHGQDGRIRALSNSCRHRGTPLLDAGFGQLKRNIVCPYHAWTYSDSGSLKGAPYCGAIKVDRPAHSLRSFPLESWNGLLFVNLRSNPPPLSSRVAGIDEHLRHFQLERFTKGYKGTPECWQANWKLVIENAIESYHLFKVHQKSLETVAPTKHAFYVAGSAEWSLTAGLLSDRRSKLSRWLSGETHKTQHQYLLIFLPPSFVGILTPASLDWLSVLPNGTDSCRVYSGGTAASATALSETFTSDHSATFLAEDKAICERLQQGMSATHAKGGKLVELERPLIDFRQFLLSRQFNHPP